MAGMSAVTPKNYGYIILNGFTCIKAIVNIYIRYTPYNKHNLKTKKKQRFLISLFNLYISCMRLRKKNKNYRWIDYYLSLSKDKKRCLLRSIYKRKSKRS